MSKHAMGQALRWIDDVVDNVLMPASNQANYLGTAAEGLGGASVAVIDSLKEAIKQYGEPVAWLCDWDGHRAAFTTKPELVNHYRSVKPLYTAPIVGDEK